MGIGSLCNYKLKFPISKPSTNFLHQIRNPPGGETLKFVPEIVEKIINCFRKDYEIGAKSM